MNIASLVFVNSKQELVKAVISTSLLPGLKVFALDKDLPVPNGYGRVTVSPDNLTTATRIAIIDELLSKQNIDCLIVHNPAACIYQPECFISPIVDGGSDIAYIRRNVEVNAAQYSEHECFAVSRKFGLFFLGVDKHIDNLDLLHDNNFTKVVTHYMTHINAYPLVSQINRDLLAIDNDRWTDTNNLIAGYYPNLSNNQMLAQVNTVLASKNRPAISLSNESLQFLNSLTNGTTV